VGVAARITRPLRAASSRASGPTGPMSPAVAVTATSGLTSNSVITPCRISAGDGAPEQFICNLPSASLGESWSADFHDSGVSAPRRSQPLLPSTYTNSRRQIKEFDSADGPTNAEFTGLRVGFLGDSHRRGVETGNGLGLSPIELAPAAIGAAGCLGALCPIQFRRCSCGRSQAARNAAHGDVVSPRVRVRWSVARSRETVSSNFVSSRLLVRCL